MQYLPLKSPASYEIKTSQRQPNIWRTFSEAFQKVDWARATEIGYRAVTKSLVSNVFLLRVNTTVEWQKFKDYFGTAQTFR